MEQMNKTKQSSKINAYFSATFIMFLGFVYNVIEQDFFGSGVFLISAIVFLFMGIINKRAGNKIAVPVSTN